MALLFSIDRLGPFGLVTIEAVADGAPVVAFRRGPVPEVVDQGATGFVVADVDEAISAMRQASALARLAVCRRFKQRDAA